MLLTQHVNKHDVTAGDQTVLGMQDFDFAKSNQICKTLLHFCRNLINFNKIFARECSCMHFQLLRR